jgi:NADP-reducing hydrogenase subunit HndB
MTLNELNALRKKARDHIYMVGLKRAARIQIGYGTCGIAAGAKPVYNAFIKKIEEYNIPNVTVVKVGCMGECAFEPIVEIVESDGTKTIYCSVNERMSSEIFEEHVLKGQRLDKYLLSKTKR